MKSPNRKTIEWCAKNRLKKGSANELLHLLASIDGMVFSDLYIQRVLEREGPIGPLNPAIFDLLRLALNRSIRVYSDFVTIIRSADVRQKMHWPEDSGEL